MNPMRDPTVATTAQPARSKASDWTIWLSLGGIALVGGIASYLRVLHVIQVVDGRNVMAYLEAALADPLIAAASVNIVDAHRRGAKLPKLAVVAIIVAAVFTVGGNVMTSSPNEVPQWLVNAWPPVATMLAFESLMSYLRRGGDSSPATASAAPASAPAAPESAPETAPETAPVPAPESASVRPLQSAPKRSKPVTPESTYAALLAVGRLPSIRAIRRDMHVGDAKAKAILADLEKRVQPQLHAA